MHDCLVIGGVRIDPSLLQRRQIEPCRLEECHAVCCSGGVWLDVDLQAKILQWSRTIKSFLPPDRHDERRWFGEERSDRDFPSGRCVETTTVARPSQPEKRCCVFLQPDNKCVLHSISEIHQLGSPGLKPFYCAIHPLYMEDNVLTIEDDPLEDLRGGWCRRPARTARPVYEIFRTEALIVLGEDGYRELLQKAVQDHQAGKRNHPRLKIVILYDADADAASNPAENIPPSTDVGVVVREVENSLQQLGHTVARVAAARPIETTIAQLRGQAPDLIFNLCESFRDIAQQEGNVAGLLELLGIPFTGGSSATLHLALHKARLKEVLTAHGIPTPNWFVTDDPFFTWDRQVTFPAIVKPVAEDASIGIGIQSVVHNVDDLRARVGHIVRRHRQPALVEEFVDGREINVAVLGGAVLEISEIDFSSLDPGLPRIVTYRGKWDESSPEYVGTIPVCPAKLSQTLREQAESLAVQVWELFEGRDYARIDMRIDGQGTVYVLEFNPNPDLSSDAGLARSARSRGWSHERLVAEIVRLAQKRVSADVVGIQAGLEPSTYEEK